MPRFTIHIIIESNNHKFRTRLDFRSLHKTLWEILVYEENSRKYCLKTLIRFPHSYKGMWLGKFFEKYWYYTRVCFEIITIKHWMLIDHMKAILSDTTNIWQIDFLPLHFVFTFGRATSHFWEAVLTTQNYCNSMGVFMEDLNAHRVSIKTSECLYKRRELESIQQQASAQFLLLTWITYSNNYIKMASFCRTLVQLVIVLQLLCFLAVNGRFLVKRQSDWSGSGTILDGQGGGLGYSSYSSYYPSANSYGSFQPYTGGNGFFG